jgi:HlyD family secretion protein
MKKTQPPKPHFSASPRIAGMVLYRWLIGSAVLLGILGIIGAVSVGGADKDSTSAIEDRSRFYKVTRGELVVSLLAPGQAMARQTTSIICQAQGNDNKISWLIPEGTIVKKGAKLVEIEVTGIKDEILEQQVKVEEARADYEGALEDYEIQLSKNRSDLLEAKNKLELAELELEKYLKGDFPQKEREYKSEITLAEAELERAQDRLEWTKKLVAKGYVNSGEEVVDQLALTRRQIDLERSREELRLLEKFVHRREKIERETQLAEAVEELLRTEKSNASEKRSHEIEVESSRTKLELEKTQLDQKELQLENSVIYAPETGMVVYARDRRRRSESDEIKEGTQVRYRQKLIELPDFSSWKMEARVHESMIQRVRTGMGGLITIDAYPEDILDATVSKIAVLPEEAHWSQPDVKEYTVDLDITTTTLNLKPGMSCRSEILLDRVPDTLLVPIQAVHPMDGKFWVWRKQGKSDAMIEIEVGLNNERFVEVLSGLNESDTVLLEVPEYVDVPEIIQRPSGRDQAKPE